MDIKANSAVNYVKQEQTQVLKKKDTEKDVETTKKVQQNEDKVTLSSLGKQQANTQVESKSIETKSSFR
jgi:hypothetical protein